MQEIIKANGYSVHIDICLIGATFHTEHFRTALKVASMERLRRIIADLELHPAYHKTRIAKLKARLTHLEKVNKRIDQLAQR